MNWLRKCIDDTEGLVLQRREKGNLRKVAVSAHMDGWMEVMSDLGQRDVVVKGALA